MKLLRVGSKTTLGFADQETTVIGLVLDISAIVAGIKLPSAPLNPHIERVV